jgi:hypothetical protein
MDNLLHIRPFRLPQTARLVPQVPAFCSEVLVQAFAIRRGRNTAAGHAELHRGVGSAGAARGKLFAQPDENDVAQVVVAE